MAQFSNRSLWNYSNISIHNIQRRHNSYIKTEGLESCYLFVNTVDGENAACEFIENTASCNENVNTFNYLRFLVCSGNIKATPWGLAQMFVIFFSIVLFLIAFMFLITKHFILPNVIHVAHYMHLPLYDFGITIIAVIMSSPQMAWIIQDCEEMSRNNNLLLTNMMGRIFTTYTVGVSVVCFGRHGTLPGKEVVSHIMLSTIVLIITRGLVMHRMMHENTSVDLVAAALAFMVGYVSYLAYIILMKRRRHLRSSLQSKFHHNIPDFNIVNGWDQLWHLLNPFKNMVGPRFLIAILAPFWLLAALQVPVTDKDRQMSGWCKYLACVNIFVFPCIVLIHDGGFSLFFCGVCFISLIILLVTIFCTKIDEPPKYQGFYAVTGIFLGFYSYYVIQGELETILWQSFTFIFNVPHDIIMLTGYVFHNVLNLVIFCYELGVAGFGNLACGVVMGIVLNNIFLMLPVLTFHICNDGDNVLALTANTTTCFVFTILAFCTSIISLSLTDFQLRICQGVFLISIYCIFLLFIILSGFYVIHPYGAFHSISVGAQREHQMWA